MERQAKDGTFYKQVGEDEWQPVTREAKDGTIYKKVGPDDWAVYQEPESFADKALDVGKAVGSGALTLLEGLGAAEDRIASAPTRQFVSNLLEGDVTDAVGESVTQPFRPASEAPTGYDIAGQLGMPENKQGPGSITNRDILRFILKAPLGGVGSELAVPRRSKEALQEMAANKNPGWLDQSWSPRDYVGLGLDFILSPTNLIGLGLYSRLGARAAKGYRKVFPKTSTKPRMGGELTLPEDTLEPLNYDIKKGFETENPQLPLDRQAPSSSKELETIYIDPEAAKLPQRQRLDDIVNTLQLEFQPLALHYDMLENPRAMRAIKNDLKATQDPEFLDKLSEYGQAMVNESQALLNKNIMSINGGRTIGDLPDVGAEVIDVIKNNYNTQKSILGETFEELRNYTDSIKFDRLEMAGLIDYLASETKIGRFVKPVYKQKGGESFFVGYKVEPYKLAQGVSETEHSKLSKLVNELQNKRGMSFSDIENQRSTLLKSVDYTPDTEEIGKARQAMFRYLQDSLADYDDSPISIQQMKALYQDYAINESKLNKIEKILGGKIDPKIGSETAANVETAIKNILRTPENQSEVFEFIGDDASRKLIASWINDGIKKSQQGAKGFKPHEVQNFLINNEAKLKRTVGVQMYNKLRAIADHGFISKRFLDDANPSGTAEELRAIMAKDGFMPRVSENPFTGVVSGTFNASIGAAAKAIARSRAKKRVNKRMMGIDPEKPGSIQSFMDSLYRETKRRGKKAGRDPIVQGARFRNLEQNTEERVKMERKRNFENFIKRQERGDQ